MCKRARKCARCKLQCCAAVGEQARQSKRGAQGCGCGASCGDVCLSRRLVPALAFSPRELRASCSSNG
jgi:hypothetical protein